MPASARNIRRKIAVLESVRESVRENLWTNLVGMNKKKPVTDRPAKGDRVGLESMHEAPSITVEAVEGFVEATGRDNDRSYICGWAIGRGKIPILLEIVDPEGKSYFPETTWYDRQDIAEKYGKDFLRSGFVAFLPPISKEEGNARGKKGYRLYANGRLLRFSPSRDAKSAARSLINSSSKYAVKGCLEAVDGPRLHGWVVRGSSAPETVTLRVEGHPFPVAVRWRERNDVAEALNIQESRVGFEIDLPGYLWEGARGSTTLCVEIFFDGFRFTNHPIEVTRESIANWIQKVTESPEGQEQQYQALLALEHLRFGGCIEILPPEICHRIREFAVQANLAGYLQNLGVETPDQKASESFVTLSHWRALRALNERLAGVADPEGVFNAVTGVMLEMGLEGMVRELYIDSLVPVFCKHDLYARLHEITDISRWLSYGQAEDAWKLTIALPAMMVLGQAQAASALLWKLTSHLDSGWLNTECIHFAVREVARQGRTGRIRYQNAEKFRYAVLGVLDRLNSDWFSRLHDRELVLAAASLLGEWSSYADYFRRDIVSGLVRNYGLSPNFWRAIDERYPSFPDPELNRARAHWETIRQSFEAGYPLHERLDDLIEPLRYFKRAGNPEAVIVLREVVMNALPALNQKISAAGTALLNLLLEDPAEGVRVAAYPLSVENQLQERFSECGAMLQTTLRELSTKPKSLFYHAQFEAGCLMRKVLDARARNAVDEFPALLSALHAHALRLNEWHRSQVAADLLAFCYELSSEVGTSRDSELLIAQAIQKAIAETDANAVLGAPVQAALGRLIGKAAQNPLLRSFIQEMRHSIIQKFGDTLGALFDRPEHPKFTMPVEGFPRDTLVVIYSCRKNLDSRVEAIRRTWVQDLMHRGIPYLVAVGGGDDTITGDILSLNVSDKYEDLPAKTLKLIDWVLDHTDFQYLYKIDDDCYLHVDRFFDTLSYRQHFYYGRILERSVGSMDRRWHQLKSHTLHARKVLDKSPEPSVYADGGGGYSLARFAMLEIRRVRKTAEGQHLVAVSLMEDKLVGDLLALAGIHPSEEDYESYQRRRTFGAAVPVGLWENTFYPCDVTPTVMTHLDTDRNLEWVRQVGQGSALWPKKLWPTTSTPQLFCRWTPAAGTLATNQLELLSDASRLEELHRFRFHVVAVVRNEMTFLRHFLDYYRRLGAPSFLFVDNLSDDGSREYLLEQPDVALFSADTEYKYSHYGVMWQQALLGNLCVGKWVLLADADEFLVYPDLESRAIADFLAALEEEGADCLRIHMIDMYPYGELEDADFNKEAPFTCAGWFDAKPLLPWRLGSGRFSNNANVTSGLRHRIDPAAEPHAFASQKYALFKYKPWMRLSEGIHCATGMRFSKHSAWFAHFKYHAQFKHRVESEIRRGQHFDNAKEYRRYAEILAESKGRFGDERLSVRYENSMSFAKLAGSRRQ